MHVERGLRGEIILILDAFGFSVLAVLLVLLVAAAALWGYAWGRRT